MYSGVGIKKSKGPLFEETQPHPPPPPSYAAATVDVSVAQELSNFCDYTSAHGLPHVKRVRSKVAKGFWTFLCVVFFGVLIYEISDIMMRYMKHDYNVLVEIKFDRKISFPAVTVCNMNAYRYVWQN